MDNKGALSPLSTPVAAATRRKLRRLSARDGSPAGHPQGWGDCFDLFVADTYQTIFGDRPDGLPTFSDGLRSARLVDAVLESVEQRQWVEVPS